MAFLVVFILGIFVMAMVIQATITAEKRQISGLYCLICSACMVLDFMLFVIKFETFTYWQIAILIGLLTTEIFLNMILYAAKADAKGDEISFQDMFKMWLVTKKDVIYQQYTAKAFASEYKLQYVSKINVQELINCPTTKRVISENNKYILFQPLYDENGKMNSLEWYGEFAEETGRVIYSQIITNQDNFSHITNLNEILLKIMQIYGYSLNNNWFINPYGFALELEDKVVSGYKGKARLLVTDEVIINARVGYDQKAFYKKKMLNMFLEDFIGSNFLKKVTEDPNLNVEFENLKWDTKNDM